MNKCKININEKDYELCLVRNSVKWLENKGISNYSDMKEQEVLDLKDKYRDENGDVGEVIEFGVKEYGAFLDALNGTKSKTKVKKAEITKA